MFAELIHTGELIYSSLQGLFMVLVTFFKALFTTPLIILFFIGLIPILVKHKFR